MAELKLFILRAEARNLYRSFLRTVREAPPSSRAEITHQIRHEFYQRKKEKDLYAVKYNLSDGRAQLKMLKEMLAMQR